MWNSADIWSSCFYAIVTAHTSFKKEKRKRTGYFIYDRFKEDFEWQSRSIISWSVSPLTEGENPQEGYWIQKHKDMYMY
jgi:hypothetical protein